MRKITHIFSFSVILLTLLGCQQEQIRYIEQPKFILSRSPIRGFCDCPYDYDAVGRLCGNMSAYSRSGGTDPMCFVVQTDYVRTYEPKSSSGFNILQILFGIFLIGFGVLSHLSSDDTNNKK